MYHLTRRFFRTKAPLFLSMGGGRERTEKDEGKVRCYAEERRGRSPTDRGGRKGRGMRVEQTPTFVVEEVLLMLNHALSTALFQPGG